ncbi:MAG: HAMP domain-containing histidine kinase [Actinomycetota bacterium]|nr:HAMP domain-containing histidine kinase [Actinomycetota bacterium]
MNPAVPLPGVVAIAAGSALFLGLLGGAALYAARQRTITTILSLTVGVAVLSVAGGVVAASTVMYLSHHDLLVLFVVVAASGAVSMAIAVALGRRIMAGSDALRAATRSVGADRPLTVPEPPTAELAALSRDLQAAHERLAEARDRERALENSRRDLVAWVSHDLRTPLGAVRAMAEALEDGVVDDPETVTRYHQDIRAAADRLSIMVDDLFELARVQARALRLSPTPVALSDLISDAVASVEPLARAKSLRESGHAGGHATVEVDVAAVGRVLGNLLANAIRMTPPKGAVTIDGRFRRGVVSVTVRDGCGGIPSSELGRVFDVGYRGTPARTPEAGSGAGLGLAITRGIVEAHGGQISVRNENGGCRFTVRLPSPPSGAAAVPGQAASDS